jgi:hypothetical protein
LLHFPFSIQKSEVTSDWQAFSAASVVALHNFDLYIAAA